MKQAKIAIGLDIRPLKGDIGKARDVFKTLGDQLRNVFNRDLQDQLKLYNQRIGEVTKTLVDMGKAGIAAHDVQRVRAMTGEYWKLAAAIQGVIRQQRLMGGAYYRAPFHPAGQGQPDQQPAAHAPQPALPSPQRQPRQPAAPSGGGDDKGIDPIAGMARTGMRALGAVGISLGFGAALSRQIEQAQAAMPVRSLTGGAIAQGRSGLGFTRMERFQRAGEIGAQAGENMTDARLSGLVNQSETLERAFGISGGQFAGAFGAARRAGSKGADKEIAATIGDAVSMKLSGSEIGDYLQLMTSYLDSLSKGVSVDQESLRGFASSLGAMDFFRQNPERIFDAIQKLDAVFQGKGSNFQQLIGYQALQQTAQKKGVNLTPAGVSARRSMGLFGGKEAAAAFRGAGLKDLANVASLGGDDIMRQMLGDFFKDATANFQDEQGSFNAFQEFSGLTGDQAAPIFAKLHKSKGDTRALGAADIKKFKQAQKTPEQLAADNMDNFHGSVVKFHEEIENIKDVISEPIVKGMMSFASSVEKFDDAVNRYISKMLGVESATPMGAAGEAIVRQSTKIGFTPTAERAGQMRESEEEYAGHLRKSYAKEVGGEGAEYEKLDDKQRLDIDQRVASKVLRRRDNEVFKNRQRIVSGMRFDKARREGKKFVPKMMTDIELMTHADDEEYLNKYFRSLTVLPKAKGEFDKAVEDYDTRGPNDPAIDDVFERKNKEGQFKDIEAPAPDKAPTIFTKADGGLIARAGYGDGGEVSWEDARKRGWKTIENAANSKPNTYKDGSGNYWKRSWMSGQYYKVEKDTDDFVSIEKTWKDYYANRQTAGRMHGGIVGFAGGGKVVQIGFQSGGYGTVEGRKANAKGVAEHMKKRAGDGKSDGPGIGDWLKENLSGSKMKEGLKKAGEKAVAGRATGGPVGHNSVMGWSRGGRPMGTDQIDAKLTHGEFVVNARDTSKNMMALVHANAGGRIIPAADGGVMGEPILPPGGGSDDGSVVVPQPMGAMGQLPENIALDSGSMEGALSGNTKALMALAQALGIGGSRPGAPKMRDVPRGPRMRYG